MGFKLKALVVVSSGLVVGVCTYAAYRTWKKRQYSADDEGFEDVSKASIYLNINISCYNKTDTRCWLRIELVYRVCLVRRIVGKESIGIGFGRIWEVNFGLTNC